MRSINKEIRLSDYSILYQEDNKIVLVDRGNYFLHQLGIKRIESKLHLFQLANLYNVSFLPEDKKYRVEIINIEDRDGNHSVDTIIKLFGDGDIMNGHTLYFNSMEAAENFVKDFRISIIEKL